MHISALSYKAHDTTVHFHIKQLSLTKDVTHMYKNHELMLRFRIQIPVNNFCWMEHSCFVSERLVSSTA
jgi:hypothetical protein